MKKIILLLIGIVFLTGCEAVTTLPEDPKVTFDDIYYEKGEIKEITLKEYEQLLNDKASFPLFVYLPGCTSCNTFRKIINKYVENTQLTILAIKFQDIQKTDLAKLIGYAPSMILFQEGEIKCYLDPTNDSDIISLETKEGFEKWIKKNANLTKDTKTTTK